MWRSNAPSVAAAVPNNRPSRIPWITVVKCQLEIPTGRSNCRTTEQNGICPICGESITELTGWHNHHIRWRCQGGTDGAENRVLLHPNCHQQVHSQKLTVQKPRS